MTAPRLASITETFKFGAGSSLGGASFTRYNDETNELDLAYVMEWQDWLDLGRPDEVMVTVTPFAMPATGGAA